MSDSDAPTPVEPASDVQPIDLAAVEQDLADVEIALQRLDDGSYWTDEVTGDALTDEVLTANPVARRNARA